MILSKNMLKGIGALALAVLLGTLIAPKVVKAAAALLVQDVDQPARAPFQVTVPVNAVTNFNYTAVTIPAGQRLVVDMVSLSGAAEGSGGTIQPIIILNGSVAGNPGTLFYFTPVQSATQPTQWYLTQPSVIYADSLEVGPAFAGFAPQFMVFNVVISGHLISNP